MRYGFSLVELSIVLVILGLLTGGILAGQSLIRAAELRGVTAEFNRYLAATQTFRDKYMALPGDMNNATSFWGAAHATPATCLTTASTSTLTCNGNGGGVVFPSAGSNESYRFWQHLANAGLIEGSYDGITHGTTNYSSTAENSPASKLNNSYWYVWNWGTLSSELNLFDGVYDNVLLVGGLAANTFPWVPRFKPEEAWNLDVKIDDGKPAQGKIVVNATLSDCTTATGTSAQQSATLNAEYLLNSSRTACTPIFRRLF